MKFGLNFGLLGKGVRGTSPILQGDYIWYSLHPDTGFLNDNGIRKINDEGNTVMVGAKGVYNGTMYSGRSVTVSDDGVIPVPINATLGSELCTGFAGFTGEIDNGDGTFDFTIPANDIANYFMYDVSDDTIEHGVLMFTILAITGTSEIPLDYWHDGSDVIYFTNETFKVGLNTINLGARIGRGEAAIWKKPVSTDVTITYRKDDSSYKEIQLVQGSVTVFNVESKSFEQVTA